MGGEGGATGTARRLPIWIIGAVPSIEHADDDTTERRHVDCTQCGRMTPVADTGPSQLDRAEACRSLGVPVTATTAEACAAYEELRQHPDTELLDEACAAILIAAPSEHDVRHRDRVGARNALLMYGASSSVGAQIAVAMSRNGAGPACLSPSRVQRWVMGAPRPIFSLLFAVLIVGVCGGPFLVLIGVAGSWLVSGALAVVLLVPVSAYMWVTMPAVSTRRWSRVSYVTWLP